MQFEVINVLNKLKTLFNFDKDGDLANAMGVNVRTYASWKNRNTIDFLLLLDFCKKNNISLDWLFQIETINTLKEPESEYKTEKLSKLETLENRIELIEKIITTKFKE